VTEVIWSYSAVAELRAIRADRAVFNPNAAEQLAERLLSAGDSLEFFTLRGRLVSGTGMRELLTVAPYIIRYEAIGDQVHILRIRHGAKRPTQP
jgi:toxin ParE1/3/4